MILGIDEVGRGPWAGPLVVGAVVLGSATIEGLTDSKKLSKKRREELDVLIRTQAAGYGLGWVSAAELDEVGLSQALVLATKRAVEQVTAPYHEIIIDGTINFLKETTKGAYVTTLPKADLLIPSVSAASIIAKVARDKYMAEQDGLYPGYGFRAHVGYGTAAHRAAIEKLGVTPLHRLSFAPLAQYRPLVSSAPVGRDVASLSAGPVGRPAPKNFLPQVKRFLGVAPPTATRAGEAMKSSVKAVSSEKAIKKTTKQIGDAGETATANYLVRVGHEIMERNWRTKFCEIDIVSKKGDTVYFTEVKYRKKSDQGGGLAAITPKKLRQMKFAAEYFALKNDLTNINLRLAVASVTGKPPEVETYLELE